MEDKSPRKVSLAEQILTRRNAALQPRADAITMSDGRMRDPDLDPMTRQRPGSVDTWLLDPEMGTKMHEGIWFVRHVSEILSEDPVRNWFDVEFLSPDGQVIEDDVRARDFEQYCEELNARDVVQTGLLHEASYGDGLVVAGIQSKGRKKPAAPGAEVTPEDVGEILYLVAKPRDGQFSKILLDDDFNSETYGQPKAFVIKKTLAGKQSSGQKDEIEVHATRALHFQTRPRVKSEFGLPIYVPLWTVIQLLTNLEWSAGQIAFNMATRVGNSDEMVGDIEQRLDFATTFGAELTTLEAVILGKDEKLTTVSNNPGDLNWLVNFTWDVASAATRINKTRLLGTQAGALASADTDMKRYYEWIHSRQELWLRKPLNHLTALVLSTESLRTAQSAGGTPVVSFRPRVSDRLKKKTGDAFRIVFRPVEGPTEKEAANLKVREAQAVAARLEGFRNLAMGMQTLADLGLAGEDPGKILRAILGPEVTEDTMSELMASTSDLEPSEEAVAGRGGDEGEGDEERSGGHAGADERKRPSRSRPAAGGEGDE